MAEMTWDDAYKAYKDQLIKGDVDADFVKGLYEPLSKDFADRLVNIHNDIAKQNTTDKWWGGDIGKEDSAWDMAFRLAETGAGSLSDIGQRQVPAIIEGENGPMDAGYTIPEAYNKVTGEPLTNFNRSGFDSEYNLHFTDDGRVIPYTANEASYWTDFRDFAKTAASTVGMLTPAAPYIAGANALNFAQKGDWGKAILAALPVAGKLAGAAGATAETAKAIGETASQANKYAKILKSLDDKNILGAALQGADLAGMKELAGYNLNDVGTAINLGRAIQSGNPMALLSAISKSAGRPIGKLGFDVGEGDIEEGYFAPGGPGWDNVDWSGYADLTPDQLAEFFGPGTAEPDFTMETVGERPTSLPDFVYDMPESQVRPTPIGIPDIVGEDTYPEMVVTAPRPERPELDLGVNPDDFQITPTPIDIPPVVSPAPAPAPKPPAAPFDWSGLLALLGGQQAAPYVLAVPENSADIKLMEDIFGTSLSAPSTGKETDQAALARLLRS